VEQEDFMSQQLSRDHGTGQELEGLSGWLIPFGMALMVMAVIAAVNFLTTVSPLLDPQILASPEMVGDGLMVAIIGNTMGYALLFAACIWAIVLYFMRHVRFPLVAMGVFVFFFMLNAAGIFLMRWLLPGEPFTHDVVIGSAVTAAAVILYLKLSRRVQRTFHKGRPWRWMHAKAG
jgi:hypothetical protein